MVAHTLPVPGNFFCFPLFFKDFFSPLPLNYFGYSYAVVFCSLISNFFFLLSKEFFFCEPFFLNKKKIYGCVHLLVLNYSFPFIFSCLLFYFLLGLVTFFFSFSQISVLIDFDFDFDSYCGQKTEKELKNNTSLQCGGVHLH